jgi:hypothetical protein
LIVRNRDSPEKHGKQEVYGVVFLLEEISYPEFHAPLDLDRRAILLSLDNRVDKGLLVLCYLAAESDGMKVMLHIEFEVL